jgi:putative metalloprotease
MLKLLLPLLLVAAAVVAFKLRARMSAQGLRRRSRPLQNDQIDALLRRLARAAGIERVEVRLLPERSINGLATDTGEIYVTQGLFDAFRAGTITARELSSVAAHELGHLALGHMRRRMVEVAGRQAALVLLGGILGRFVPYFGWMAVAWLLGVVTARLSRRDEFEADAYATALMVRSGLGAEHQARMLEKLPGLIPGSAALATSWLASHPPVEERAAAIRANARRWRDHAPQASD